MDEVFNKSVLFDNISYLLRKQGKKIGDFETKVGVSPGYISRTSKDPNSKPGIDFIVKVADELNVSIDVLLRENMSALTPTEEYILKFLGKLARDTMADKLDWECESAEELNRSSMRGERIDGNSLFDWETFYEDTGDDYPEQRNQMIFTSKSYGIHTCIDGDCFNLRMKNRTELYIMDIRKTSEAFEEQEEFRHTREIWMCSANGIKQYLCNNKEGNMMSSMVDALYDTVAENASHPKIKKEIKSAIDAFFNDDLEDDDPDKLPFD